MICPYGIVDDIIFPTVCNRELLKIDTVLELQIIGDSIIWVVESVCLFWNVITSEYDSIRCICIAYRHPALILPILSASKYTHMVPIPAIDCIGRIHFQDTRIKSICNG